MTKTSTVKWVKGIGWDGTARYTFEGRDPQNTLSDIRLVVYVEREREYSHDSKTRNFYYGYVEHYPTECADTIGRFKTLKEAKEETLKLFNDYCEKFPNSLQAV